MTVFEKPYLGGSVEVISKDDPFRGTSSTAGIYEKTKVMLFYRGRGVEVTRAAQVVLADLLKDPVVVEKLKDWG